MVKELVSVYQMEGARVDAGYWLGVSGELHAAATLPPGKEPWYPFNRTLDGQEPVWVLGRSEISCPCLE
jgi:hypothetical protein